MKALINEYWKINEKLDVFIVNKIKAEGDKNFIRPITILFQDPDTGNLMFESVSSIRFEKEDNDLTVCTQYGKEFPYSKFSCVDGTIELISFLNGDLKI